MKHFQNILVSTFNTHLNKMQKDCKVSCSDIDEMEDEAYREILKQNGVKSFYSICLKSLDNHFIGILSIGFIKKETKLSDKKINDLIIDASLLSGYLESGYME